jgi:hypothetical protein
MARLPTGPSQERRKPAAIGVIETRVKLRRTESQIEIGIENFKELTGELMKMHQQLVWECEKSLKSAEINQKLRANLAREVLSVDRCRDARETVHFPCQIGERIPNSAPNRDLSQAPNRISNRCFRSDRIC